MSKENKKEVVSTDVKVNLPSTSETFEQWIEDVEDLIIVDKDDYEEAEELLKKVGDKWKTIEDIRKQMVDPLNKSKTKIQAFFNPSLKLLDGLKGKIKTKMLKHVEKMSKKEEALAAELKEETGRDVTIVQTKINTNTKVKSTKKWRIIDVNLVPKKYLGLNDEGKAFYNSLLYVDDKPETPGIEYYSEKGISL